MTTYLLLALTDDGRVTASDVPADRLPNGYEWLGVNPPVRTGNDRNAYSVYEVGGWSIDVVRMPEAGK